MERIEIVVIDNGSTDRTVEVVKSYASQFKLFRFSSITGVGLSLARNRGITEASAPWVLFLDDDARAAPNLIERILNIINYCDFDCFGGRYLAWFKFGKPKWLPKQYGTMPKLLKAQGYIDQPNLAGGVMIVKRSVLDKIGGFSIKLGMTDKVGYGEDSEIQFRMLRKGYKLGFDPDLLIYHCVLPHKFDIKWQLKAAIAKGRNKIHLVANKRIVFLHLIGEFAIVLSIRIPYAIFRLFLKEEYYWQNAILSVSTRFLNKIGELQNPRVGKTSLD